MPPRILNLKIKNMKKNLVIIILTFLPFFLSNCKKSTYESENSPTDYTILIAHGYDTTGIKDFGQYYRVEGDIVIPKSSLTTLPRQAMGNSVQQVALSKQRTITVRIDNSVYINGADFDWSAEVPQAIAEFNNLETSNIRLTLTSSTVADITIKAESISGSPNTIAEAPLPSGGNPGSFVRINTTYSHTPTNSGQKKYNLVHELGHCIGLNHTNWYDTGEGPFPVIGNSPNSNAQRDLWSVMNGGTAALSWIGFTDWDIYAISFLYASADGIPGSSEFCTSATYGYSNLPVGSYINWTVPFGFTSSTSGNFITLTRSTGYYADATLQGEINLPNGSTINVTKLIKSNCNVSVEFKNTGSQYVSGAINFALTSPPYSSYSGTVSAPYSSTYTTMTGGTYTITASRAPSWDPYYVSIGGGTPKYISSYGTTSIGTYYVGNGFVVNVWR